MSEPELTWRPTASLAALRRRAELNARLRAFFHRRGVLEVETPLLSAATVTDPHLASVGVRLELPGGARGLHLQTSPEFHMKRLLAAGSGPIYQLFRAVRDGEAGRRHNPEFTLLEWYRPGFDHHALMDEVDELLADCLGSPPAERVTYADAFGRHVGVDPHRADSDALRHAARAQGIEVAGMATADRDAWLDLLMVSCVEPHLGRSSGADAAAEGAARPTFLYDYPASQAALARVRAGEPPVAERFEVYVEGVELANGFHELRDAVEQRRRFAADLETRRRLGVVRPSIDELLPDEHLLAALEAGLPPCAGVALGVDRLAMLRDRAASIEEVLAFPIERA
ncbi:MAG: EF-P lysine aminoacylase EpmA [Acidobacteriota bacterium]